jgi:cell division protein FtsI/penicillin-binding protein 2
MMDTVPEKANRVLNMILLLFLLIGIRVWYLAVVKHEEHVELARKPQEKTVIQSPNRGTIRDRFNIPLAVNQIQYNAAICYDPIRQVPRVRMMKGEDGIKKRVYYRKEYIQKFASTIGNLLNLDPVYIEDLIWSKGAVFPNTPFIIKENITETEYYQMRILERDWPGLEMQISSKRHYPLGPIAGNVLGFMGSISSREHFHIQEELKELERYLEEREMGLPVVLPKGFSSSKEVKHRFLELKDKSYTIHSKVGKSGVEGKFDDQLRGICGRAKYEVNMQGAVLSRLPESYEATSGRRFILSISSELQQYAEELLAKSELTRIERFPTAGKDHSSVPQPWIKGGAIVAMIPKTGEIVALASYPRFDPNDFVDSTKRKKVNKWLETPEYIGQIWDGISLLEREFPFNLKSSTIPEERSLSWDLYLEMILSRKSGVRKALYRIANLHNAIYLQNSIETLLKLSDGASIHTLIDALFPKEKGHIPTFHDTLLETSQKLLETLKSRTSLVEEIAQEIHPFLTHIERNDDKILALDLLRLVAPNHLFDDRLLTQTGEESLSTYRGFNQTVIRLQSRLKELVRPIFHKEHFQRWRSEFFKEFLEEKRKEEKEKKQYQRPYLDYLEEMENLLFSKFFEENKWSFLASFLIDNAPLEKDPDLLPYHQIIIETGMHEKGEDALHLKEHLLRMDFPIIVQYLQTMRSFNELNRPLWGRYYFSFGSGKNASEKDLARSFYPSNGFGYTKSFAYQENTPLGSTFKIVTAYEGLRQHYQKNSHSPHFNLNPLTIIDQSPPYNEKMTEKSILGYSSTGAPLLRQYKGGRVPRGHLNIGRIDLKGALERSSNLYFALLCADVINKPSDLSDTAFELGLGRRTGIDLSGEVAGTLPSDLNENRSGLYAFSIGQHSLTTTPLQTAVLLSTFANGGFVLKPQIVKTIVNLEPTDRSEFLFSSSRFPYQDLLAGVGIHFPLFTEVQGKIEEPYLWKSTPEIRNSVYLPPEIRTLLLESLYEVMNGERGTSRPSVIRTLTENESTRRIYNSIRKSIAGKTSTAEITYRPCIDREFFPILCKHIWFGGMLLHEAETFEDVDLVVVAMFRYGDSGKETAPLAAQIAHKWKEITSSHESTKARSIEGSKK